MSYKSEHRYTVFSFDVIYVGGKRWEGGEAINGIRRAVFLPVQIFRIRLFFPSGGKIAIELNFLESSGPCITALKVVI